MNLLRSSALVAFTLLVGCGGGQPAPPTAPVEPTPSSTAMTPPTPTTPPTSAPTATQPVVPAPSATTSAAVAGPPPGVWGPGMTTEQQSAFMNTKIVPAMSKVFQDHDAKRYGSFSCTTCHGQYMNDPHKVLPRLTFKDGKITSFADKPAISKWMAEKVTPAMATAMGQPPFDPKTHQGFGCGGCHAVDMK